MSKREWVVAVLLGMAVLALVVTVSTAQPADKGAGAAPPKADGKDQPPPPGDRGPRRPPGGPLMQALDTDKDGDLSAEEIAKAPESLLTLDKNGDGKLTRDELFPPPPMPPDGKGRPDGQGKGGDMGGPKGGEKGGRPPRPPQE